MGNYPITTSYEANGKADGAEIGMLTVGGFWDEFLHYDVEKEKVASFQTLSNYFLTMTLPLA